MPIPGGIRSGKTMRTTTLRLAYETGFLTLLFYIHAVRWKMKHGRPQYLTGEEILRVFYYDFLGVPREHVHVVEVTEDRLVTRCDNACPILDLAEQLGKDTKEVCLRTSERGCKFFLRSLSKEIKFERNYDRIRPHASDCEETITIERE
jgi:hypothetical protein